MERSAVIETRARMLARLRPGLSVRVDVRGRAFWAVLLERADGGWNIEPPRAGVGRSYHHVTTQQIREAAKDWSPADSQVRSA